MWRCERIQLQLFYLRWLNALPKVCHRQGRIWNKQKKNPFRLGFSSTFSHLCSFKNRWTAKLTWFTFEFVSVLFIDKAGSQSAKEDSRCQETYGRNNSCHHRSGQALVRQLWRREGIWPNGGTPKSFQWHLLILLHHYSVGKTLTCTRNSDHVAALTDQVVHDSHHSKLIPGLLPKHKIRERWLLAK